MATGGEIPADEEPETGVATHLLRGEIVHLHSVLEGANPHVDPPPLRTRAWEVLRSCYDRPNSDYLVRDDPAPFVRDMLNVVESVAFDGELFGDVATEDEEQTATARAASKYVPFR